MSKLTLPHEREVAAGRQYPLYVSRPLINYKDVRDWYAQQWYDPDQLADPHKWHVTLAYSTTPVECTSLVARNSTIEVQSLPQHDVFGPDNNAFVLKFASNLLSRRHELLKARGAVWTYTEYRPHVSLIHGVAHDADEWRGLTPWPGVLVFGPERWEVIRKP